MFWVEGVKYTTARTVAEAVVDRLVAGLGVRAAPCRTDRVRVDEGLGALDTPPASRVREAVRSEMAVRLSDIVFRRSLPGTVSGPSRETVAAAARIAAGELAWPAAREAAEIEEVMRQVRGPGRGSESAA